MDFHCLTRRELQALCKRNKIPANLTNVAMADALKALDHVEGLSDNLDPVPDTPKRPEILSPDLPRTTRRTSTRQKTVDVSEPSDTPVTRNGRRRAAATSVRSKIEAHRKEDNEGGEEAIQKEYPDVPVHSVRRSARLSDKRISTSIQKKGSRRVEAVKIAVLSEEEAEDLEKEQSTEGSEISVLGKYKETDRMISGEVLNNGSETFGGEESSLVNSSDTTQPESSLSEEICKPNIEEADKSVTDNDVYVTEPLVAEVQGSGSLVAENEKELHGPSETGLEEDKYGATLVPEYMSTGKICNSPSKESVAETSSPKGSNSSKNKEFVVGDLIGNEQQRMDSLKVDESSDGDDEDTFVVQNQENKESGEDLAVDESGVISDCGSTEGDIYEIQPLETTCLNLCPTENPEIVGNKECNCGLTLDAIDEYVGEVNVEVLSEAEEISYLSPEKTSEIQPLVTRCLHLGSTENPVTGGCKECDQSAGQLVLQIENVTNQLARVVLQSETDDSVSVLQQKMNEVPELENVADPDPTKVLAIEKHSIDESNECFDETAENGTEMNAGSGFEEVGEKKSCEEPEKCDQAKEPGTIDAGIDNDESKGGVVSPFSYIEQEEKSSQERDFNVAAHVATADVTVTDSTAANSVDAISSILHLEGKISLPSPANNATPTSTAKKSLKTRQTPRKSGNKKQTTPTSLMISEDNKENTPTWLMVSEGNKEKTYEISSKKLEFLSIAIPDTAQVEMEKKKDAASLPKGYENTSKRQLIKMIKEKEKQVENKRTALQTLNKN
ncbi:uncharacterized protein LOC122067209 [Macadamia integrifolia]|uniref:uncharacterized protein LOC122067209 n=1 Tax=Macadamia integrifolia TaxID=60698 RepID=UPI001C4F129C|nr:uncharacterized protein LOC122067209 [Macadamia integrifolia]